MDRQRIDKWLWHARIVKTRTSAAGLVAKGHVRVNSARVVTPGLRVDLLHNIACLQLVERLANRGEGNRCALVALDRTADLGGAHRTRRIGL